MKLSTTAKKTKSKEYTKLLTKVGKHMQSLV
jgi:hypothetical protein